MTSNSRAARCGPVCWVVCRGGCDHAPPLPISRKSPAVTRTGIGKAQWCLLGKHRLICSNATHPVVVSTRMGNERAHMAFTDPSYNVHYANSAKDKLRITHLSILNDNLE